MFFQRVRLFVVCELKRANESGLGVLLSALFQSLMCNLHNVSCAGKRYNVAQADFGYTVDRKLQTIFGYLSFFMHI